MLTVIVSDSPNSRRFDTFQDGDILVVPDTRIVGMKLNSREIVFFNTSPLKDPGIARHVSGSTIYLKPTSAELRVIL